jgi:pimeloyl-ACP methyl ester carboxylesterase
VAPLTFKHYSNDGGRFWLYDGPHEPDCGCVEAFQESGPYSMSSYTATSNAVHVPAGTQRLLQWDVWYQPSPASTIISELTWFGTNRQTVVMEQMRIHPLVFIPGILGTMPPTYEHAGSMEPILRTYDPLLTNLQMRGYELNKSLFPFPVDWRDSIPVVAGHLADSLPGFLQTANQLGYVGEPASGTSATKVDLVVHSMGGLITRSYVEGDNYQDNVGKAVFIATPHRGFPEAYRTQEGLTWDTFLNENLYQEALGKGMDMVLWPVMIGKRYGPTEAEMQAAGCLSLGFISCPHAARYNWSHDPVKGVFSLLEMLPDEALDPYLVCGDPTGVACIPSSIYPFGRQTNPLLDGPDGLNVPGRLRTLADRLGGPENIFVIYGSENPTNIQYAVRQGGPPLWAQGEPVDAIIGDGDGLVPSYSANLSLLMPYIPAQNVVALTGPEARHKSLMYHPLVQTWYIPNFLTGTVGLPATEYVPFPPNVEIADLLVFIAQCPVNLTITDPQGRRVGFDPATGGSLQEIPGAVYPGPNVEGQFIVLPSFVQGKYQFNATAFGNGAYVLSALRLGADGLTTLGTFSGNVTQGEVLGFEVDSTPPITPPTTILGALDDLIVIVKKYAEDREIGELLALSLLAKLQTARDHFQHGRERAAANRLEAFVDQIEEQRGKRISDTAARDLIPRAEALIDRLVDDDGEDRAH